MRVFTVLGPSHSGKSTLVDDLGRLDGPGGTTLKVTEAARLHVFKYLGDDWAAFDIAGGPDNIAYAGPAMAASDAVVLCVPPESDAAVLSAPYLRLIEESGLPCYVFVNKMDTITERVRDIVASLQSYCSHNIVLRQIPIRGPEGITGAVDLISERAWEYHEGTPSSLVEIPNDAMPREQEARTELLESLADFDDALLELLIEDQAPMAEAVYDVAAQVLQHNDLVPAFLGSASHKNGITRLMKSLRHEAPGPEVAAERLAPDGGLVAVSGLADMIKHLGKIVALRAFGGGVSSGAMLGGETISSLTEIDSRTAVQSLDAGRIGLAVKSDHLQQGRLYTASGVADLPDWAQPRGALYRRILTPVHERDESRLSTALARLSETDPGLEFTQDEQTGHAVLGAQGPIHARHTVERLKDSFGVEVELSSVPAAFRETIKKSVEQHHRHRKQSGGAGQFADIIIDVKPTPRGSGFQFDETVKGGAVPRNYIPSVEHGAQDALVEGPHGYPVVDVHVTLKDGKHHNVDSSDFAFRRAGKDAVRDALNEAGTQVLQPVMKVQIHVPSVFAGGLAPTISGMKGQVLGFEGHPTAAGWDVFNALLPAAAHDDLFTALSSATRGTAWFVSEFDHYQEARAEDIQKAETAAQAHA